MTILLTLVFVLVSALILFFERRFLGNDLSPAAFLALPFFLVLLMALFVGPLMGFKVVTPPVLIIWIVGMIAFTAGGYGGARFTQSIIRERAGSLKKEFRVSRFLDRILRYMSWFFILILLGRLVKTFILFEDPGSDLFTIYFAGGGFSGHCLVLLRFNLAFHIATANKKRISDMILIVLSILFLFAYHSKVWIFFPIFAGLVGRMVLNNKKITMRFFLKLLVGAAVGFVLVYIIPLKTTNPIHLINHFFFYMFSGILGLGTYLDLSLPVNVDFYYLILPVQNVINLISGNIISTDVSEFFVNVHHTLRKAANVKSFFGTIFIYGGLIKGILVASVSGLIVYSLQVYCLHIKRTVILILYIIFLTALFLGWFDFYFNKLFFYEISVYAVFLLMVENIGSKIGGDR